MEEHELSDLEKEFKEAAEKYLRLIHAKVSQASQLLSEACTISEEHGIPFDSNISFLSQAYIPSKYHSKYKEVDSDVLYDATGVYNAADEGWEHSAIC